MERQIRRFPSNLRRRFSFKKVFLKISQNSGKHLCLFSNKVAGLRTPTKVFSYEFCNTFKNTFLCRTPPVAAFDSHLSELYVERHLQNSRKNTNNEVQFSEKIRLHRRYFLVYFTKFFGTAFYRRAVVICVQVDKRLFNSVTPSIASKSQG